MTKLCDLVDIMENNENCVILQVKSGKELDLIKLGCFDLTDNMFRLTKGANHTCTIFKKDGQSYDWHWGTNGYTLVSDNWSKKGKLIEQCITEDFGIYIGEDKQLIQDTLYIKTLEDTKNKRYEIKSMYFENETTRCVHKDGEYYKHFSSHNEFKEHFENLGEIYYIDKTRSKATNCIIENYVFIRK